MPSPKILVTATAGFIGHTLAKKSIFSLKPIFRGFVLKILSKTVLNIF